MAKSSSAQIPSHVRLVHRIEDLIEDINWIHVAFKTCAYTYILLIAYLTWQILPLQGHWNNGRNTDKLAVRQHDLSSYFSSFDGYTQCGIQAGDLYSISDTTQTFCPEKASLLQALSQGGRVGFDAPYAPKDCKYSFYTVPEICMILERFEHVIFVGDDSLQPLYNSLNIFLQQDLIRGAMQKTAPQECQCSSQFIQESCLKHSITDMSQAKDTTCTAPSHTFLRISNTKLPSDLVTHVSKLHHGASNYKPIVIIYSIFPTENFQVPLLELLDLVDHTKGKTPVLVVGPATPGHVETKHSNQQVWQFHQNMAKLASEHDVDFLGLWNFTIQANTNDGIRFDQKVALTEAMMVFNWLARL